MSDNETDRCANCKSLLAWRVDCEKVDRMTEHDDHDYGYPEIPCTTCAWRNEKRESK